MLGKNGAARSITPGNEDGIGGIITPNTYFLRCDWFRARHMICLSFTSACHERNANYSTELFNDSLATDVLVHGYPGTLTTLTSNIDLNELLDNLEPGVMNRMCAF